MKLLLRVFILFLYAEKLKIHSEVVRNFNTCTNFFYKNIHPIITFINPVEPDPEYICQTLGDVHRFATFYSKYWRIPLYSAYELAEPERSGVGPNKEIQVVKECVNEQKSRGTWFIEPQVYTVYTKRESCMSTQTAHYLYCIAGSINQEWMIIDTNDG